MRNTAAHRVVTVNADHFGIVGVNLATKANMAETKRERKKLFLQLKKLYSVAWPGDPSELHHISIGLDSNGVLNLYFHTGGDPNAIQ